MTDRKNESRTKHDNASVISSMYDPISQIHNDSKAPESVDDRHAPNHSHLPNISQIDSTSRSQLFFGDQAKGSYSMKKMFGR
jgi:hypothetical protein